MPATAGNGYALLRHLVGLEQQAKARGSELADEISKESESCSYLKDPSVQRLLLLHYQLGLNNKQEEMSRLVQDWLAGRFPEDEGVGGCATPHSLTSAQV